VIDVRIRLFRFLLKMMGCFPKLLITSIIFS